MHKNGQIRNFSENSADDREVEFRKCIYNSMKVLIFFVFPLISSNASLADLSPIKNLKLAYDVFIGDMLAVSVDIDAKIELKRYSVESRARSHGIFEILTEFKGKNKVVGHLNSLGLRPEYYKASSSWMGKRRTVEINYETLSHLSYKTVPTAADDNRDPVPVHFLLGTMDPMTAIFNTLYRTSGATVCDNAFNIFDGRRRYDAHLSEAAGSETKGPLYAGSARVCRIRQTILAGASRRIWLPLFVRPKWTDFLIASVRPDLPPLPVEIKADLGFADLVARLVVIGDRKFRPGATFAPILK